MSGYKHATVTISQEEYRRLHEADMKKKFREHGIARSQNSPQEVDLSNFLQQLENRQRQLEQALFSIDQNPTSIDEETIQEIFFHNAQFYARMAATLEESNSCVETSLTILAQRFDEEMQRERENYNRNIYSILTRMDSYNQFEQRKENYAWDWLSQAMTLANFINDQFDHERIAPGRLVDIQRNLDFSRNNLEQGFFEASLQNSQRLFLELSDLHIELEQRILLWQTEFKRTFDSVKDIVDGLESNSSVQALGLQGEYLPNQVDLDFWTNGKYHHLLGHCQRLLDYLIHDQEALSTEDFLRIHSQILPAVRESFESIIYEARLNALNSQLRMNIAEKAMLALENHGFVLGESGYANDDMRAAFTAQMDCPDGSQVSIQVLPSENEEEVLSNELVVITNHPYLKTEHEARLRWEELSHTLAQYSLKLNRTTAPTSTPPRLPDTIEVVHPSQQKLIDSGRQSDV